MAFPCRENLTDKLKRLIAWAARMSITRQRSRAQFIGNHSALSQLTEADLWSASRCITRLSREAQLAQSARKKMWQLINASLRGESAHIKVFKGSSLCIKAARRVILRRASTFPWILALVSSHYNFSVPSMCLSSSSESVAGLLFCFFSLLALVLLVGTGCYKLQNHDHERMWVQLSLWNINIYMFCTPSARPPQLKEGWRKTRGGGKSFLSERLTNWTSWEFFGTSECLARGSHLRCSPLACSHNFRQCSFSGSVRYSRFGQLVDFFFSLTASCPPLLWRNKSVLL